MEVTTMGIDLAKNRFCRKVDINSLLSTIYGIFRVYWFQYVVCLMNFATEPHS